EYAMRIGEALHCEIRPSIFHRKNYFYPDMPKDYQVSQYDEPINVDGWLELPDGTRVGIERAHMEEDTGKTTHVGGGGRIHDANYSLVDYNRAGVPLVEIVARPDLRGADGARAYVDELRGILVATGASDGKMEEGSLRVDANVSVRKTGLTELGTRCEIKNMNSLRSLGRAIEYEARRQVDELDAGNRIVQETRHWNEAEGRTTSMRSKEEAFDYRYFPEPDLVPVVPDAAWIEAVRAALPPMPADRRAAVAAAVGEGAPIDAVATVVVLGLDTLVLDAAVAGADARLALNRVANELATDPAAARRLEPAVFAKAVTMEGDGRLTATQSKAVLAELLASGGDPEEIAKARGFEAMSSDSLTIAVDAVLAEHPDEARRLAEGDGKMMGFFVGKVMAATGGKADGKAVTGLLRGRTAE
ncbi:MAG TPA: Asp-tRNA(Asn)/Glu-tRNA(Gln) amidotransferase subunit GatB, partial [Acidimicrobiales bacterium]|nr:Asp-tRNA(Asn)/Glu-tRNA(Gln) amidotransferase subunit GatB [Acidimicrobiales bacterium]